MKTVVLYRPNSEHARGVEEFIREFSRRNPQVKVETMNIDGREGMATASLYDIMAYPAILALRDDGGADNVWQGEVLPLLDEVASYTRG